MRSNLDPPPPRAAADDEPPAMTAAERAGVARTWNMSPERVDALLDAVGAALGAERAAHRRGLDAAVAKLEAEIAALKKRLAVVETRGVRYRGVFQKADDYKRGDCCTHQGSLWIAIRPVGPGEAPPGTADAASGWQLGIKGMQPK